ncbi:MAG: peptidoglycan-binding protein [Pseudomonadota bacterium]
MQAVVHRVLPRQADAVHRDLRRVQRSVSGSEKLARGDRGAAVEALQRSLRRAGVYSGDITGSFDGATQQAVQSFQQARGLHATGRVNPATASALKDNTLFLEDRFEQPAHRGQAGADVLAAERRLTALGYNTGKVDGVFDARTARAVREFRASDAGLANDKGALDREVWQHLQQAYQGQVVQGGARKDLSPGDTGKAVRQAERRLDRLGFDVGKPDSRYDAATAAAVARFQRTAKLDVTGRIEHKTARAIDKADHSFGTFDTVPQANKHFLTQWGPTRYNKTGPRYGYKDCAPTSAVMAASALGLIKHPGPGEASRAIDHMRDLTRGHNTNTSDSTSREELMRGLRATGAAVRDIHGFDALNRALAKGHPVLASGDPWDAWGRRLRNEGKYLNSRDPGNHSIAILGRTDDGRYLVADPLSRSGSIAVKREALAEFLKDGSGNLYEVSRAK